MNGPNNVHSLARGKQRRGPRHAGAAVYFELLPALHGLEDGPPAQPGADGSMTYDHDGARRLVVEAMQRACFVVEDERQQGFAAALAWHLVQDVKGWSPGWSDDPAEDADKALKAFGVAGPATGAGNEEGSSTSARTQTIAFQTSLEKQHLVPGLQNSALQINPHAEPQVLLFAALARMQAITEGIGSWMLVGEADVVLPEILRPFEHLAEEVAQLLDALGQRLSEGGAA